MESANKFNKFEGGIGYWKNFLADAPRKQIILSLLLGIARIGLSAIWPFLLYSSVKGIGKSSYSELIVDLLFVVFLLIAISILSHIHSKINIEILKRATLNLIVKIWQKINALDWLTFHTKSRVYFFDTIMMDAWRVRAGKSALLETLFINTLISVALCSFVIYVSWEMFLLCFGALLVSVIGYLISVKQTRPYIQNFHKAWRKQHMWIAKSIDQFDLIRMGRGYEESESNHLKYSSEFLEDNSNVLRVQAQWRNINQFIGNFIRIAVLLMGAWWVHSDIVTMDELLLSLIIITVIQSNILQIPGALNSFVEAQEALKSIQFFFKLKEEEIESIENEIVEPIEKISISNVKFSFDVGPTIHISHLCVERGKVYLWQGKNGSGKSTAAHILLGLLEPESGNLEVNGGKSAWSELRQIRKRFTFLNQDSPIFMGSVKENLLFGNPMPADSWLQTKHSWMADLLPKSMDVETKMVGDQGEGLSGGEAKRIALVRELLRDSELLILDEPLNHLDDQAIFVVKNMIQKIKQDKIVIIISHQNGFEDIADEIKEF